MEYYQRGGRVLLRLPAPISDIERWIPHRHAWVKVTGHEDIISPFSSYGGNALSEEEAEELKAVVPDMSEEFLDEYEIKPGT